MMREFWVNVYDDCGHRYFGARHRSQHSAEQAMKRTAKKARVIYRLHVTHKLDPCRCRMYDV